MRVNQTRMVIYLLLIIQLIIISFPIYSIYICDVNIGTLDTLVVLNLLLVITIYMYCFSNKAIKERFTLFAFNTTYTVLILGTYIANIGNDSFWGKHTFQLTSYISILNEAKALVYIFMSLLCVFISYLINDNVCRKKQIVIQGEKNGFNIISVRKWSKLFMYLGAVAAYTKALGKFFYVSKYGYLSTYLEDGTAFYNNIIVDLFDKFYIVGLFGYLATFPSLKKIKLPIIMFVIYNMISLATGTRGELIVNTLFILWYLIKRDRLIENEKIIISRRKIIALAFLLLFAIVFLYDWGYQRVGANSSTEGFFSKIIGFINNQGSSGRLVALSLENRDNMIKYMSPFMMIFWPINNFFINNTIVRMITGGAFGQNLNITQTPIFSATITYVTNKNAYLNGGGLGTSYVAELATSYGMIAIVVFGLILGYCIRRIDSINVGNWRMTTFIFNAYTILIYIPRQSTLGIVPNSVAVLLFILMISMLCKKK